MKVQPRLQTGFSRRHSTAKDPFNNRGRGKSAQNGHVIRCDAHHTNPHQPMKRKDVLARSTSGAPSEPHLDIEVGAMKTLPASAIQREGEETPLLSANGANPAAPASASGFTILGLHPSPELLAIGMVYFVQGSLGLSRLALFYLLKDDLGLNPAEVAILTGLSSFPWVIKPLYGFLSDSVPLWGYKRRSYLVACGLLGTSAWLALAFLVDTRLGAVLAMLVTSLATACSDVVVDSIVVERARGAPQATAGSLQSLCWGCSSVGSIASAYFSGSLVQQYGVHVVFGITAVFPLAVSAAAALIDEQPVVMAAVQGAGGGTSSSEWETGRENWMAARSAYGAELMRSIRSQGVALWAAVTQRQILLPSAFVFLWQATPAADTAMTYYQTNHLHFTPEFLGRIRLAASIASLAGVLLYNGALKTVPLRKMLFWAMVLGTVLGSTQLVLVTGLNRQLGLSDELFVLGDSVVLTVLGQVSFMPILVLAARLCPEGVEATLFATLMSILNGGAMVGSALGALLTDMLGVSSTKFDNLALLIAICSLSTMAPAPFLNLIPHELEMEDGEKEGERASELGNGASVRDDKAN